MLFRWFNRLALRRKLFAAFFIFTCIIVFVASISFWFYIKRGHLSQIIDGVELAMVDILKITKLEEDFFSTEPINPSFYRHGRSIYLDKHQVMMADMQKRINELIESDFIDDFKVKNDLEMLLMEIRAYNDAFQKVTVLTRSRGYKEKGLEGEMRYIIHKVERNRNVNMIDLLNLRRYEKDYLLRKEQICIDSVENIAKKMMRTADSENYSQIYSYLNVFKRLVEVERIIGDEGNRQGLRYEMRVRSDKAVDIIQETSQFVNKSGKDIQGEFQNIFMITMLIVIVVSLTFSYFIAFYITIPVVNLSKSIRGVVEQGFTDLASVKKYTQDEIGDLTDNFNFMLHEIQRHLREVRVRSTQLAERNLDLKNANKHLLHSEKRLESFLAVKENFFSIVSHDLKSPLSSLKGFLKLLEFHSETFSKEELQSVSRDMYDSFDQVTLLINSLLQWAKTQVGDFAYEPNRLSVNVLIKDVIDNYQNIIENKNIKIITFIEHNLAAEADANMINFVMRNLFYNTLRFSNENGIIEIRAKQQDDFIEVSLKDNGEGIALNTVQAIFQTSIKIDNFGTGKDRGSGFELMMCRDFIEKNGGKMHIDSQQKQGNCVVFTLKKALRNYEKAIVEQPKILNNISDKEPALDTSIPIKRKQG
jgi:signal transduction histidine kinase